MGGVRVVLHAYKGEVDLALNVAKTGRFFFSFPPSVVYKKEYQEVAKAIPQQALLLETDSPSLGAGGPSERNEPAKISIGAAKIAELRGVSVDKIAEVTTRNAVRLFGEHVLGEALKAPPAVVLSSSKPARWRKETERLNGS